MQKNLQIWQAIIGFVVTFISASAWSYNLAFKLGGNQERMELTQKQHGERITKVETNAELDRKEVGRQFQLLNDRTYEILIFMQNKQDRKK